MGLACGQPLSNERFMVTDSLALPQRLINAVETPAIAGKIRNEQNWIGGNDYNPRGADFLPPPPDEVEDHMADLCKSLYADTFPPVVLAALIHAQFETIHPFADGNGRAGRA